MKKNIFTCLFTAFLLIMLHLPAEARTTVGLLPTAKPAAINQQKLSRLDENLSKTAGMEIRLRMFDNDSAMTNWMLRFQEVDAAIVTLRYLKEQPAGTLIHLADVHLDDATLSPLALVARSNLSHDLTTRIAKAFTALGSDRELLQDYGLSGVTPPGQALKKAVTLKVEPPQREQAPPKAVLTVPEKQLQPSPRSKETVAEEGGKPAIQPRPEKQKAPEVKETAKQVTVETESAGEHPLLSNENRQEVSEQKGKKEGDEALRTKQLTTGAAPEKSPPLIKDQTEKTSEDKRLFLFLALLVVAAVILKGGLFVMRWRQKKASNRKPEQTPAVAYSAAKAPEVKDTRLVQSDLSKKVEILIVEEGRLGPGKVPALLKRCADFPEPVVLQVSQGDSEKLIYFAAGQVAGAQVQQATAVNPEVRWKKLGELLVREGLISAENRAQALELQEQHPDLRFGEALLKLGLINLTGLRQGLTRYARVTIYSLILYPEGDYKIFRGSGDLSPEESISLEITSLMREASQHQSEWTAIRQALPKLNTALDFAPLGRDKLTKVNLSPQQEETLAFIDGKQSINALCNQSTMLDYEVYRFLYLMVRASVLQ